MSRDHSDADRLNFENGSVSVSINGATQNTSEDIFAIVARWASACPQPQRITLINGIFKRHIANIQFFNYWMFQIIFTVSAFLLLRKYAADVLQPYSFLALVGFFFTRSATSYFNSKIGYWCDTSGNFSLFNITGGDSNQQTKNFAKSSSSTIKLICSVLFSLFLNVIAVYFYDTFPLWLFTVIKLSHPEWLQWCGGLSAGYGSRDQAGCGNLFFSAFHTFLDPVLQPPLYPRLLRTAGFECSWVSRDYDELLLNQAHKWHIHPGAGFDDLADLAQQGVGHGLHVGLWQLFNQIQFKRRAPLHAGTGREQVRDGSCPQLIKRVVLMWAISSS